MLREEDEAEEEEREEFRTARSAPSWAGSANSASSRSDKAAPWNDPPSWAEDEPPLQPREPMPTMPVLEATLYDTLGVAPSASQSEIKRAYHRLSKQLHPDKNPGNKEESERMFHAVRCPAHQCVLPALRSTFDRPKRTLIDRQHHAFTFAGARGVRFP